MLLLVQQQTHYIQLLYLMKFVLAILVIVLNWISLVAVSQPANAVYANTETHSSNVTNQANAINAGAIVKPDNSFATLTAATVVGTTTTWIQLAFPASVTATAGAPKTVYIRTNDFSAALLGGGIDIEAYTGASGTTGALSAPAYSTYALSDGTMLLGVVLSSTFRSARVTLRSPAALGSNSLNVYHAFYGPTQTNNSNPYPFNAADCGLPNVTQTATSGLTVGSFGVTGAGNAIDADPVNTKSTFYATGLSVLSGTISQTFYFNGVSNSADAVRLVLSQGGSLVALDLAKSISVQGYNGDSPVGTSVLLNTLLDADLLGLLGTSNTRASVYFAPKNASGVSVVFDKVIVSIDIGLLGVALGANGLNIHDVRRVPDMPASTNISVCNNIGSGIISALTSQESILGSSAFTYKWYSVLRNGVSLFTGKSYSLSGLTAPGQKSYYVEIEKGSCGVVSARKETKVTTVAAPITPLLNLSP